MTQDPLGPETTFDLWRMINDQNCYTIILLSKEEHFTLSEKVLEVEKRKTVNKYFCLVLAF